MFAFVFGDTNGGTFIGISNALETHNIIGDHASLSMNRESGTLTITALEWSSIYVIGFKKHLNEAEISYS